MVTQAIDKWLRKKEIKPQKQITEFLQRRQARIRDRIKETIEEVKRQQQATRDEGDEATESSITITPATTDSLPMPPPTTIIEVEDDDVMVID